MKIMAVDNEPLQLRLLEETIAQVDASAQVTGFQNSLKALEWARAEQPDVAFLDIQMPVMNGIELARELKLSNPQVNLVFVTGYYEDYVLDAVPLHFSGYLQKPATAEAVAYELEHLRFPLPRPSQDSALLTVQCFGTFEVFCGGTPVHFARSKTKELFAYLVDRKGASVNTNALCANLYEDSAHEQRNKSDLRKCVVDLRESLKAIGAEEVFVHGFNSYSIAPALLDCDYYNWEKADPAAIRAFRGEYMAQYSWAEPTLAGILGL